MKHYIPEILTNILLLYYVSLFLTVRLVLLQGLPHF